MRVGLDLYTIQHRELSPEQALDFVVTLGLDGLQFLNPEAISPGLDPGELRAFRNLADSRGLYLEVGLTSPNPIRRSRMLRRTIDPREHARMLERQVRALSILGCQATRSYVGDRHDRFRTEPAWDTQLAATFNVLELLEPCLRDYGMTIALETHADVNVDELLRLIDALGPEIAGVTLDTGNLLMRLDEPLGVIRRLAPLVRKTHIKDAVLALTDRGLCWQARPVGEGIVPIAEMLRILQQHQPNINLSIELHPRIYDLPIYNPEWLRFFPELRTETLAAIFRLAALCEQKYVSGAFPRPHVLEAVPWDQRDEAWINQSRDFLRRTLRQLEADSQSVKP